MATTRKTTTRKTVAKKKETVTSVVVRHTYILDADDESTAVRVIRNGDGNLKITRVNRSYYDSTQPIADWDSCDDEVTLRLDDLKTAVAALEGENA